LSEIISKYSIHILGVVKRNPLFFHSISYKNNVFLFTTLNITRNLSYSEHMCSNTHVFQMVHLNLHVNLTQDMLEDNRNIIKKNKYKKGNTDTVCK